MTPDEAAARARSLPCWRRPVVPHRLPGGRAAASFRIDDGRRHLAKIGGNDPAHGIRRTYEAACCRAAHRAGVAPEVAFAARGALVLAWIEGRPLTGADLRREACLARIAALLRRLHGEGHRHLAGRAPFFWVFHALRDYGRRLAAEGHRLAHRLPELLALADELAAAVGPVELALCHNDLAPARFLDDGGRLWLVGWGHGGYDTPWFDLACLAAGGDLDRAGREALAGEWLGRRPDGGERRRLEALVVAALLREAMRAMVEELRRAPAGAGAALADCCLQRCALAAERWRGGG